jgi:hypothetical protein
LILKAKWLCAGTAWETREIGMTQPSITISLGAERKRIMIALYFTKRITSTEDKVIPDGGFYSRFTELESGKVIYTFLHAEDDKGNLILPGGYADQTNPLTSLGIPKRER